MLNNQFTHFTDKLGNKLYFGDEVINDKAINGAHGIIGTITKHVHGTWEDELINNTAKIEYIILWGLSSKPQKIEGIHIEKLTNDVAKNIRKVIND